MDIDFDQQLSLDFINLLELCKSPEDVFTEGSLEFELSQCWLDKLCRYECEELNDRRQQIVYMSHLAVCLNEGCLTGPFVQKPPCGKLEEFDIEAPAASCSPCCARSSEKIALPPGQTALCSNKSKSKADVIMATPSRYQFPDESDATTSRMSTGMKGVSSAAASVSPCLCPKERSTHTQFACNCMTYELKVPTECIGDFEPKKEHKINPITGCTAMRQTVINLLKWVNAELRGKKEPNTNPLLETELERYKKFLTENNPSVAANLLSRSDSARQRLDLILHMQLDLVILLTDDKI